MLNRKEILNRAFDECMEELYLKAQPSADYKALIQGKIDGTVIDTDDDPIYKRYYISEKEMKYIVEKYKDAYNIRSTWKDNMDVAIRYLMEGGLRDIFVKGDDEKPGYRSAEPTPRLSDIFGKEKAEVVYKLLKDCRDFYKFDREESDWSCWIYLGGSPSSNPDTVKEYWKSQGVDVEIEEREPDSLWYRDMYGDKWKEIYDEEMEEINKVDDNILKYMHQDD